MKNDAKKSCDLLGAGHMHGTESERMEWKSCKNHVKCHFASAQLWKTMNIPLEIVNERISAIGRDQLFIRRKHNNAECSNGAFLFWRSAKLAAAHSKETNTQNDKESTCCTLIIHIWCASVKQFHYRIHCRHDESLENRTNARLCSICNCMSFHGILRNINTSDIASWKIAQRMLVENPL